MRKRKDEFVAEGDQNSGLQLFLAFLLQVDVGGIIAYSNILFIAVQDILAVDFEALNSANLQCHVRLGVGKGNRCLIRMVVHIHVWKLKIAVRDLLLSVQV